MDNKIGFKKYEMEKYWSRRAKIGKNVYEKVCAYGASYTFNVIMDKIQKNVCLNYLMILKNH